MSAAFKSRLTAGDRLTGLFLGLPSPAMVEMIGYAGFDFVILDAEHGPAGTAALEHMMRAANCAGIAAIVRVAGPEEILHALDAGAAGILVPHVTSAACARDIVAKAYFPPRGSRGISGLTRAARYGFSGGYLASRHEATSVIAMIEDADALPHVADIATTEGVDALFIGPADLAGSMGFPGQPNHPKVVAAIARIVADARASGPVALASTGRDASEAARLSAAGVTIVCLSAVSLFGDTLRFLKAQLDQALPAEAGSSPVRTASAHA